MEHKILIGNTKIDDLVVVEYSYHNRHFQIQYLSEALKNYRFAISSAIAENREQINDYLPIGIVESFENADVFIREYQKANHLPYIDPLFIDNI